jgi:hypothetical protein
MFTLFFLFVGMSSQTPFQPGSSLGIIQRDLYGDYMKIMDDFLASPVCPATSNPGSGGSGSGGGSGGQQIALASYIHPASGSKDWVRINKMDKSKVTLLVANVLNGPNNVENTDWTNVIRDVKASGKKIIGYVRTGYLGVPADTEFVFKTRLGSRALSDWIAQIEEDIEMWYKLYPNLDGIFFDEGWNHCGPNDQGTKYSDVYDFINAYTKRRHPGAYTVLNPGDSMPECFKNSADTLLTYESNYTNYLGGLWKPLGWATPPNPRKIWHIVYKVPESELANVAALAWQRGAGLIELVDNVLPNPYDKLPSEGYMKTLLDIIPGGSLEPEKPASLGFQRKPPQSFFSDDVDVSAIDYTSASLKWYSSGASFEVRVNDVAIYKFPGGIKEVTIGGLNPASSYTFQVFALGEADEVWFQSRRVTRSTLPLPSTGTISKYSSTNTAGTTIVKADVLVPYAFVRIFFWDRAKCDFENDPAYPIKYNYKSGEYVCAKYMVENQKLFKYVGPPRKNPDDKIEWKWEPVGLKESDWTVGLKTTGYTNEWSIPMGSSTFDTKKFVVQAEGYGPENAVVIPSRNQFDCKGSSTCKANLDMEKWCDEAANGLVRNDQISYGTL